MPGTSLLAGDRESAVVSADEKRVVLMLILWFEEPNQYNVNINFFFSLAWLRKNVLVSSNNQHGVRNDLIYNGIEDICYILIAMYALTMVYILHYVTSKEIDISAVYTHNYKSHPTKPCRVIDNCTGAFLSGIRTIRCHCIMQSTDPETQISSMNHPEQ